MACFTLELSLLKNLEPLRGRLVFVAVSGGVDSMALLHGLASVKRALGLRLEVAHVHHGEGGGEFRNQALAFVKEQALVLGLPFVTNEEPPDGVLTSEAELREFRHRELLKMAAGSMVALAHQADDLLETRILRLIRGVGPQGLKSMQCFDPPLLRPLLEFSRRNLIDYLNEKRAQWLEDPSNAGTEPLRNWLRRTWLPALEERQPGALRSLGRSLDLLSKTSSPLPDCLEDQALRVDRLRALNLRDQQRVVAHFFHKLGLRNYGLGHVREILKNLDRPQKNHTFRLLRRQWIWSQDRLQLTD